MLVRFIAPLHPVTPLRRARRPCLAASFSRCWPGPPGKAIGRKRLILVSSATASAVKSGARPRNGRSFEVPFRRTLLGATMARGVDHQDSAAGCPLRQRRRFSLNATKPIGAGWTRSSSRRAPRVGLVGVPVVIERSQPGAVMAAYNRSTEITLPAATALNDVWCPRSPRLLMSVRAEHPAKCALAGWGECGAQIDGAVAVGSIRRLRAAYADGNLPKAPVGSCGRCLPMTDGNQRRRRT